LGAERGSAPRCKLDGKRNAVEVPADRRDCGKSASAEKSGRNAVILAIKS
jgi:hypothetical protein